MKPALLSYRVVAFLIAVAASPVGVLQPVLASAQFNAASTVAARSALDQIMARVEKRISQLHSQLKITAAEELQWQQLADVMRENAKKMYQSTAERAQKLQSMNAVENLKSYADLAARLAQNLQRRAIAFENLYNSMTPEQQKLADQVFRGLESRKDHDL